MWNPPQLDPRGTPLGKFEGNLSAAIGTMNNEASRPARPDEAWLRIVVGRCRLTVSKPVLKAPVVSALGATI
jgi:hypothetical protein